MKLTNEFKSGGEPPRHTPDNYDKMSKLIGRDARPVQRLNPPVFEEDLRRSHNPHIAYSQTLIKTSSKNF